MNDFSGSRPMLEAGVVPRLVELVYVEALLLLDECQACFEHLAREAFLSGGVEAVQMVERHRDRMFAKLDLVLAWARARRVRQCGAEVILAATFDEEGSEAGAEALSEAAGGLCRAVDALHARVMRIEMGVSRAFAA